VSGGKIPGISNLGTT